MKEREGKKSAPEAARDRHLWQIMPVRDVLWFVLAVLLVVLIHELRQILLPIFAALLLAYLINPAVSAARERWKMPRMASVAIIFILVLLAGAVAAAWVWPLLRDQTIALAEKAPAYVENLGERYGFELQDVVARATEQIGIGEDATASVFKVVKQILGTTTNILLWVILLPLYFAFFTWHYQSMVDQGRQYLSAARYPRLTEILRRMDEAVGTFFRARVLISLIVGVVFAVGWWLANVPYWFLLGAITGILSMVPYLSIAGWILALLLKYLDTTVGASQPGFDWMAVLLWPSLVFAVGNFIEGWVLTPLIHGRQTRLSPIMILTIVLIGGGLGGFWGLLLAIPVAICLDILFKEFVQPRLTE